MSRPRRLRALARESREDLSLGLRADPFHVAQAACFCGGAQLVGRADAERAPERDHALRSEADEPAERNELRLDLALELLELGDATGLDELDEPALDPRADPPQVPGSPGSHELGDGRPRLADQLGGPPVGAHGVVPGACQIEQSGVRLERLCNLSVAHAG